MWEKLPNKGATALVPFEALMAITSEFLYQYNLPSKKVKGHPEQHQVFSKIQNYVTLKERSSATEESRSLW